MQHHAGQALSFFTSCGKAVARGRESPIAQSMGIPLWNFSADNRGLSHNRTTGDALCYWLTWDFLSGISQLTTGGCPTPGRLGMPFVTDWLGISCLEFLSRLQGVVPHQDDWGCPLLLTDLGFPAWNFSADNSGLPHTRTTGDALSWLGISCLEFLSWQ